MKQMIFTLLLLVSAANAFAESVAVITLLDASVQASPAVSEEGVHVVVEARGSIQTVLCPPGQVANHCALLGPGDIVGLVADLPAADSDGEPVPVVTGLLIRPVASPSEDPPDDSDGD